METEITSIRGHTDLKTCIICGDNLVPWAVKGDRVFLKCNSCGFIAQNDPFAAEKVYETDIFTLEGNRYYYEDDSVNIKNAGYKLHWVHGFRAQGNLLDVGCNFGHFLSVLPREWDAKGIEISGYAAKVAREKFGVSCMRASIFDTQVLTLGSFDVVTMWDVLEHLPEPGRALSVCYKLLKKDGLLFISTPDAGSFLARILGKRWYHLDPVQHMAIFSGTNLSRLLRSTGFDVLHVKRIGHYYNLKYLLYRGSYSYPLFVTKVFQNFLKRVSSTLGNRHMYLCFGDVLGICARKK